MTITVKELKKCLESIPDEAIVVLAKDAEGNEFAPLYEVGRGDYLVHHVRLSNDRRGKAQPEIEAVILWPA